MTKVAPKRTKITLARRTSSLPYAATAKKKRAKPPAVVPGSPGDLAQPGLLRQTFSDIRVNLDELDRALIAALAELARREEMTNVRDELAYIAQASFCIRGALPEAEVTP